MLHYKNRNLPSLITTLIWIWCAFNNTWNSWLVYRIPSARRTC